jgi:hypothetical protein
MTTQIDREFSKLLESIAKTLDISPTQHKLAVERYQAVGNWLDADNSALKVFRPQIRPQGSFRLGTVIKPLTEDEEYDVDLTCKLIISKSLITQKQLKKIVGDRLKQNEEYKRMLAPEKRRCWRLQYAEVFRFHLDIVPSIPDDQTGVTLLELRGVPKVIANNALCITDNETWDYATDFPKSNPEGYALWFYEQMKVEFQRKRILLADSLKMSVDEVPEFDVKTPLQRVVQLLKRHRDIRYGKNDDKPISIIITTLSALSYENETDVLLALQNVLSRMDTFIERDISGNYLIKNPVNPSENFADKWNENPKKANLFFEWLEEAREDFKVLTLKKGLPEVAIPLKRYFGENVVTMAFNDVAAQRLKEREENKLFMAAGTGILSTQNTPKSIPVTQHRNYGNDKV